MQRREHILLPSCSGVPALRVAVAILLLDAAVFLSTCSVPPSHLDLVRERGVLRVVTRNSPTTYYIGPHGPAGLEYDLASAFADDLGVELQMYTTETFDDIVPALLTYGADLAAAGLTVTEPRKRDLRFTPAFENVRQLLIYRMGAPRPRTVEDLIGGRLAVVAGSSHAETLRRMQTTHPKLSWIEVPAPEADALLYQVLNREFEYTVADSNEFAISRRYHPELRVAFELQSSDQLAWALRRREDTSLYDLAADFIRRVNESDRLARLREIYYGHTEDFDYVGTRRFLRHIESRLGDYLPYFEEAAERHGLDWRLLAAVGYQESHWNPAAVSPTGVRGLMMLTQATARQLGVSNRLDPRESIFGGARYLIRVRAKIPARIPEPDRTWMALAAYNVGFGHLEDARILTQRHGKDPDRWTDVREHLPLLAQSRYYKTVKRGYARGWEPVIYVDNVRSYHDLLTWYFSRRNREAGELMVEAANR